MTTELQDFKSRATEMIADPAGAGHRGIIAKAIRTYDEAVVRGPAVAGAVHGLAGGACVSVSFLG